MGKASTSWRPGQSGNPAGKPKGCGERSTEIRNLLHANASALAQKAVDMALDGDATALRICLERLCPALKSRDAAVQLAFPPNAALSEQGRAILTAMAGGQLTPDQCASLLGALSSQARLVEMETLEARIAALEASHGAA
jgi:hypothetical protein